MSHVDVVATHPTAHPVVVTGTIRQDEDEEEDEEDDGIPHDGTNFPPNTNADFSALLDMY